MRTFVSDDEQRTDEFLLVHASAICVRICLFVCERSLSSVVRLCLRVCCELCAACVCMDFDFILTTTLPDWYAFVSFHVELYVMRLMWDCDSFFVDFFRVIHSFFFIRFVFNSYCDSVIVIYLMLFYGLYTL